MCCFIHVHYILLSGVVDIEPLEATLIIKNIAVQDPKIKINEQTQQLCKDSRNSKIITDFFFIGT